MKQILLFLSLLISSFAMSQVILLDPGHGYRNGQCENRPALECATNLAVAYYTKNEFNTRCPNGATVHLTRWTDEEIGSNISNSLARRVEMSNSLRADRYLSIHCNGGGNTGTESFYCYKPDNNSGPDRAFASKVQREMVTQGSWYNRRMGEDNTLVGAHYYVLKNTWATSTLNEIGFVDNPSDAMKLQSATWRKRFAKSYYDALKSNLNLSCSSSSNPPGFFRLAVTAECSYDNIYNKLNWDASSDAFAYKIFVNDDYLAIVTGTSYNHYWIGEGRNYTYRVVAMNSAGSTLNANGNVTVTGRNCTGTNLGPFYLSASVNCLTDLTYVLLNWTTSDNATKYEIYRNDAYYGYVNAPATSFANFYFGIVGNDFDYKVLAVNETGSRVNEHGNINVPVPSCERLGNTKNVSVQEIAIGDYFLHSKLTISPNPASNYVNILFDRALEGDVNIEIYDINGVNVLSEVFKNKEEIFQNKVDVSILKPGYYTLRLIQYDNSFVEHFLKK